MRERPPSLLALPSYLSAQVSKLARRDFEAVLADEDLVLGDHGVLVALSDFGPSSQQDLADGLDMDKAYVGGRLDVLEDRRLVRREPDPGDRRRHRVVLTTAGRGLVKDLSAAAEASQHRLLATLTPEESELLVGLLARVIRAKDAADPS